MPKLLVLPTQEDQLNVQNNQTPENFFEREFATEAETKAYIRGIEAVQGLDEFEILEERDLSLALESGGNTVEVEFASAGEKKAYLQGLEDTDGFVAPQIIDDTSPEYEQVLALIGTTPAP